MEVGKIADMLLLTANPLHDIRHAQAIDTLLLNGRVFQRKDLDAMIVYTAQQASSFSMACKFLWGVVKPFS